MIELIKSKIDNEKPLSLEEGLYLYHEVNILELGKMANEVREKLHGRKTFYNWNLHLNATNVCEADCIFCSFARLEEGMPNAYTMNINQAKRWIKERYQEGMTEIHIVNGLHSGLDFEYYEELLKMIRESFPKLHIKGFTAVEIHYFAEKFSMTYKEVLNRLVKAGLGSLPGGGAEIFAERVRKKICREKANEQEWLEVHRTAHKLGLKSNCTMLYGTVEKPEEIVDHLIKLRDLQSETGGFQTFIPLAFHNEGNRLKNLPEPTGMDDLKIIALSRLMLNNIPNIKAYWIMLGIKIAQIAQNFGANDFDGTVTEEKIYHMAGSETPNALTIKDIKRIIKIANCDPVERTTLYDVIEKQGEARALSHAG